MGYKMNYSGIKKVDMLNGPGLRVILFVSGCSNKCKGCHNPETHDPSYGKPFTEDTLTEIVEELQNSYYSGFTLCGGDPLYPSNRKPVCDIVRTIKACFGNDRSIWAYTGYTLAQVKQMCLSDPYVKELISYIDVLLEGPYIEELKSPEKPWVGSSNQNVLDVIKLKDGTFDFKLHVD